MANVTIRDVAKRARVSAATVSRVMNGNYPVSEESATRVRRAVEELSFTPHSLARNLKNGTSRMVGVIASNIVNPTIMQMVKGVESVLETSNYLLTISSTDNDPKKEALLLRYFRERRVDAVIVITSSATDEIFEPLRRDGIPVVLLDRSIPGSDIDTVVEDNFNASRRITEHIIARGHRRIMAMRGGNIGIGLDRYRGFLAAMREHGVPVEPHLQLEGEFSREKAKAQTLLFYERHGVEDRPTVAYAFNNPMAEGVMEAVYELGMRIPEDVSIASFGQVGLSKVFRPAITCVSQSSFYMGQRAGRLALRRLGERHEGLGEGRAAQGVQIVVESEIVEGDSLLDLAESVGAAGRMGD